jgi:hypothetical protein
MADVELIRNGPYDAKCCRAEDKKKLADIKTSQHKENLNYAKEVLKERWKVGKNGSYDTLTFGQGVGSVCEHNKWSACRYPEVGCAACPDKKEIDEWQKNKELKAKH